MRQFQYLTPFLLATADVTLGRPAGLDVQTTVGKVIGIVEPSIPGVKQWLGVPFAEPPLGALRFLPPVKKEARSVIHAQTAPPSCQQWLTSKPNIFDLVPEFNPPKPWSEDCLYLNVFAPTKPKSKGLPVLIWIHGGQMTYGGIETPYEKSQKWVQRSQEHIVVQVNYRMNIFGFPNAPGLNQSQLNVGLLDIRHGVEWVRDNIANFGGDPKKIILWGHSAGAGLIDAYQYAWHKDPIATGVIQQAGLVFQGNLARDLNQTSWAWISKQFNCTTGSPQQVVECMRGVDANALEKLLQTHSDSAAAPPLYFGATADNITGFAKTKYLEMAKSTSIPKLPSLMGTNSDEGSADAPFNADGVNITQAVVQKLTFSIYQCTFATAAAARFQGGADTWRYYYAGNFTNISPKPWMGAYHFGEIPLVTGTHADYRGNSTPFEYALSERMQDLWLAFAKDPKKGLTAAGWPKNTGTNGTILVLGQKNTLVQLQSNSIVDAGLAASGCVI